MKNSTTAAAIDLAKSRWAQHHNFDLHDETWTQLFREHFPGDILEAVRRSGKTRDPKPETVFQNLTYWIERFESERTGDAEPMWPPTDTTKL
jgi:hypothetical protein